VKVIGRLPGERSALSLLWAVLDRAASGWRGIVYTPADVRLLQTNRTLRDLLRAARLAAGTGTGAADVDAAC
jgi:putative transposase